MVNAVKRRPLLLNLVTEVPEALQPAAQVCEVVHAHEHGGRAAAIAAFGPQVEAVVTHGVHGLTAAEMDRMPRLSIVSCIGAGFENVDLVAARSRAIALSYGPSTNAATTADHAVAMLFGIVRDLAALEALGPGGYLVNIARGSLVDTGALAAALRAQRIAGAALDVFEGEPNVPSELLQLENVLLTPHLGGRSPDAEQAMAKLLADNLAAHFEGRALATPIPG